MDKKLNFSFGFEHLAATVKATGADVVAQMGLASGGLNGNTGHIQRVVRAVHTALGRRFFILLDSHVRLLDDGW
jgi:hypothetical protein